MAKNSSPICAAKATSPSTAKISRVISPAIRAKKLGPGVAAATVTARVNTNSVSTGPTLLESLGIWPAQPPLIAVAAGNKKFQYTPMAEGQYHASTTLRLHAVGASVISGPMSSPSDNAREIQRLLNVMIKLRDPDGGCPWDLEQDFTTIAPYTIEEAYEVWDAIAQSDMDQLRDELGDLLLQVVFHAQMANEIGAFSFADVSKAIADKMVARHPHVFATSTVDSAEAQSHAWEAQKAAERQAKAERDGRRASVLDGLPLGLPALMRAFKLQNRAARVGFDWPDTAPVLDKVEEEIAELRQALHAKDDIAAREEFGDLLFSLVNLARHLEIDAEEALRQANRKFEARFRRVEERLGEQADNASALSLEELDRHWEAVKVEEKNS